MEIQSMVLLFPYFGLRDMGRWDGKVIWAEGPA